MTDQHQDTEVPLSKDEKSTRRSEEVHALKDSDTTSEYYNNETQDENRRLSQKTEEEIHSLKIGKSSKQSGGDEDKSRRHSSGGSRISFQKLPKISDNDSASKYEISNEYPMSDMSNNLLLTISIDHHTISLSNESASSNDLYSNGSMSGIPDQSRQYLSIDMERLKHQKSEEDLSIATLSGYTHHGLQS
ncbi:unnamed protein product [Mytilus edulis]|uniref:Uncharacterized protein n=1 Tax=Mytilus edulis TaxID=6550 RepID=A0A8S3T002_MYTED|nr:unnamed protein product [Mytilus edulis]